MDLTTITTKDKVPISDILGRSVRVASAEEGKFHALKPCQVIIDLDKGTVKVTGMVMPLDGQPQTSAKNNRTAGKFGTFDPGEVYAAD